MSPPPSLPWRTARRRFPHPPRQSSPAAGNHRLAGPGSAADTPEAGGEDDDCPESVRDRLIYVIDVEASGRPTITPMKATLRKDGTVGKTARRYDASRLYWTETPKFCAGSTSASCAGSTSSG